jgi:N-acetyl-anhydromuramyl-L-alanine amidase AmpD
MRFSDWATRVSLIFFMLAALMLVLSFGKAKQLPNNLTTAKPEIQVRNQYPQIQAQQIEIKRDKAQELLKSPEKTNEKPARYTTTEAFASYTPRYEVAAVDSSNYGDRYTQDINGTPVNNQPIIVLHETGYSAASAINFFQNRHEDESVQASYHTLIKLDGTVVYLVPPEKRAYGAANSVFEGLYGAETVKTHPTLPPSVNNFAYHVSLETPPDGRGENYRKAHSGYTEAQYHSLAWLIAQSQIPEDRITTHQAVDRSGQKVDPVSFDFDKFLTILNTYREISPVYRAQR